MSKDTQTNSINTLDPIFKAALKSLDLQTEKEIERYERFKNIMSNLANGKNDLHLSNSLINDSPIQTQALALAKRQSSPPVKLPSFGNKVVNSSQGDFLKQQIFSLVHQSTEIQSNREPEPEETIPDDYLESSENLLRSLKSEKSQNEEVKSLKGVKESLFTPFGVASFLMLLSAGGLLFSYLGGNKLLNAQSVSKVTTPPAAPQQNQTVARAENSPSDTGQKVNLDLGTISTLKPNLNPFISNPAPSQNSQAPIPTEKPVTSVEVTRGDADLASALLPPSLRHQMSQTAIEPTTNLSQAIVNTKVPNLGLVPVPVPPPPSAPQQKQETVNNKKETINQVKFFGDYYYVLVSNTEEKSLTQARKVVKDAYLVQFPQGVRIQMGAFDNQKAAQELAERLKQQGVTAEIYRSK